MRSWTCRRDVGALLLAALVATESSALCKDAAGDFTLSAYRAHLGATNECSRLDSWQGAHDGYVCCGGSEFFFQQPSKRPVDSCAENTRLSYGEQQGCVNALFAFECEFKCSPKHAEFLQGAGTVSICPRCADYAFEKCSKVYFPDIPSSRQDPSNPDCRTYEGAKTEFVEYVLGQVDLLAVQRVDEENGHCVGGACPNGLLLGEILGIVFGSIGFVLLLILGCLCMSKMSSSRALETSSEASRDPVAGLFMKTTTSTAKKTMFKAAKEAESSPEFGSDQPKSSIAVDSSSSTSSDSPAADSRPSSDSSESNFDLSYESHSTSGQPKPDTAWGDDVAPPEYFSSSSETD
jgi:hypothetical protein